MAKPHLVPCNGRCKYPARHGHKIGSQAARECGQAGSAKQRGKATDQFNRSSSIVVQSMRAETGSRKNSALASIDGAIPYGDVTKEQLASLLGCHDLDPDVLNDDIEVSAEISGMMSPDGFESDLPVQAGGATQALPIGWTPNGTSDLLRYSQDWDATMREFPVVELRDLPANEVVFQGTVNPHHLAVMMNSPESEMMSWRPKNTEQANQFRKGIDFNDLVNDEAGEVWDLTAEEREELDNMLYVAPAEEMAEWVREHIGIPVTANSLLGTGGDTWTEDRLQSHALRGVPNCDPDRLPVVIRAYDIHHNPIYQILDGTHRTFAKLIRGQACPVRLIDMVDGSVGGLAMAEVETSWADAWSEQRRPSSRFSQRYSIW